MDQQLSDVLDALYEGMLSEPAWQQGLTAVSDFLSASGLALFSVNPSTGVVHRSDLIRNDPELMRQYGETWIGQDPRHAAGLERPAGIPLTERMLVKWRDFVRTPVYNEFLKPADIPLFMATWVERRPSRGVVLSLQRGRTRGPFDEEELRRMAVLIPHIRRVVTVKDRLSQAQVTADSLLETMDKLPFGLLLLTDELKIVEASATARALLRRRDGLHSDAGHLGFVSAANKQAFANRLREDAASALMSDAIVVRRSPPRESMSVLVMPVGSGEAMWLRPSVRWLVLIFDPETLPSSLPERSVQLAFGLTPAEATLARRLADGQSLAVAADALGVTKNTARTQLKSIFSKTGVNSQLQLVRRILLNSASLGGLVGNPSKKL